MSKTPKKCHYCETKLDRDTVGLNKKLFESQAKQGRFMCLACMAEVLECTEEDLRDKIEDFKREGCRLFS